MRIFLRSPRMFFVICLPRPPANKLMVWLWSLHQVQLQLIFLCAVLKINSPHSLPAQFKACLLQTVCLSLYINIFREKRKFVTKVYRKKTVSGVYTNFNSFIPETYKTGLIESLLLRCRNLCSYFVKFHHKINILKSIFYKNSYPRDFAE